MILNGFGFSGFRSIGDDLVKVAPLNKINMIIGRNNVGKSNIINYLKYQYPYYVAKSRSQTGGKIEVIIKETDTHISQSPIKSRIGFPVLRKELDRYINTKVPDLPDGLAKKNIFTLLNYFADENGDVWFIYNSTKKPGQPFDLEWEPREIEKLIKPNEWNMVWQLLTKQSGGDLRAHWVPETVSRLSYIPISAPHIEIIPAIRKIGEKETRASDFSGEGIIDRLAKLQNPQLSEQSQKEKFLAINHFVQEVLENSSSFIEIPYERDMILVHMDGKTLPLESLGTGVHEVIILGAAATLLEESILCIEEPELHLHPLLQRKLLKYLSDATNNQYIFTTHSAHLLDIAHAQIFHVNQANGKTKLQTVSKTNHRSKICHDLGYKASDILQANCIIWVEGPSDRIYLNYWLKSERPDFIEGIHYSIMFYGGRLFNHLTALDRDEYQEELDDFITVRNLNRNSVIMFDSDKSKPRARISKTKKRLMTEFDKGSGFAWITQGREVENYLDYDKLEKSVLSVHPSAEHLKGKDQWANLLIYKKKSSNESTTANKVKVARHYTENNKPDLSKLDLKSKIVKLCKFISEINNIK